MLVQFTLARRQSVSSVPLSDISSKLLVLCSQ